MIVLLKKSKKSFVLISCRFSRFTGICCIEREGLIANHIFCNFTDPVIHAWLPLNLDQWLFDKDIKFSKSLHLLWTCLGDVVASRKRLMANHIFCNITEACMAANEWPLKWPQQILRTPIKPFFADFIYGREGCIKVLLANLALG